MSRDEEFETWYDEYFCGTQGDDSPFCYTDVKIAFYTGWKISTKKSRSEKIK